MIRSLIGLTLLVLAGDLAAYQLYLEPVARIHASQVSLKDVARLEGQGPAETILLGNLSEPYYMSREELLRSLKEQPEATYGSGVWIVPLTKNLSSAEIVEQLKTTIKRIPGGDIFLATHTLKVSTQLQSPEQGIALVFRLPSRVSQLSSGRRIVAADIVVPENGKERTLIRQQIDLEIRKRAKITVATRRLTRGETVKTGDFRIETRESDSDSEKFAGENPVGLKVLSDVEDGKPLHSSEVQKSVTVRRGQTLILIHQTPGIVLRCKSTALSDGEPGHRIDVRILLPSGQKSDIRKADVIDENTAVLAR